MNARQVESDIRAIADAEIASGRERGLQIVAYLDGKKIVDVAAGTVSAGVSVTPHTHFMTYSVTKGVSSAIIARTMEAHESATYTDTIAQHWPAFAACGKENITIAEALGHRAGLRARSLMALSTLLCALRGDIDAGMDAGISWIAACAPSWRSRHYARYHPTSWSWVAAGIYAHLTPSPMATSPTGSVVTPHIRDGAVALARALGIAECDLRIGELGPSSPDKLLAPLVVPISLWPSLAWCTALWSVLSSVRGVWSAVCVPLTLVCVLGPMLAAWVESLVWCHVGNMSVFLRLSLPSSNGIFTARCARRQTRPARPSNPWASQALTPSGTAHTESLSHGLPLAAFLTCQRARLACSALVLDSNATSALGALYGALANGGRLADGTEVLSPAATSRLRRSAEDAGADVSGWPQPARNTLGFSPWLGAQVEDQLARCAAGARAAAGAIAAAGATATANSSTGSGPGTCAESVGRLAILGHTGMGGCCAYADMTSGLAIAVLKNAFSPECINGGGPGRVCVLVDRCLRDRLGLVGGCGGADTPGGVTSARRRPARSPARR